MGELLTLEFRSAAIWRKWLAKHHQTEAGVWARLAKAASGIPSMTYAEALEEALCFGWIDGQKKSDNADYWLQKFTPRGRKSIWSKINREKVLALIESGRMQPAGLLEMERAKSDGRWESAYDSQSNATVPADLEDALKANQRAARFFKTLAGSNRYAILFRIHHAKKPETRARKIAEIVAMLERGETFH